MSQTSRTPRSIHCAHIFRIRRAFELQQRNVRNKKHTTTTKIAERRISSSFLFLLFLFCLSIVLVLAVFSFLLFYQVSLHQLYPPPLVDSTCHPINSTHRPTHSTHPSNTLHPPHPMHYTHHSLMLQLFGPRPVHPSSHLQLRDVHRP